MIVVADTSPITVLLHLQLLDVLHKLYGKIYIPLAVAEELQTLKQFGYNLELINNDERFIILHPSNKNLVAYLSEHIDNGEAEAIALAKELNANLILIDEKLGKQYAIAENLVCKGVIGVLIEAKHAGYISLLKPLMDEIIVKLNFRIADNIYHLALQKAGE